MRFNTAIISRATLVLSLLLLAGCDDLLLGEGEFAEASAELAEVWAGEVESFEIVDLDVPSIAAGLEAGQVELPFVREDGEEVAIIWPSGDQVLRRPTLTTGALRSGTSSNPTVQEVQLPPEQNYVLGDCALLAAGEAVNEVAECGAVTVMDTDRTMLRGLLIDAEMGIAYIEPLDLILDGRRYPGLHVLYNAANTPQVVFASDEEPSAALDPGSAASPSMLPYEEFALDMVLDGDVEFYDIDPATVWSRQESIFNALYIIYGILEPISGDVFQNVLGIKGQEVWISGGPTTTNKDDLIAELIDPDYFLLNPVSSREVHLFFPGYNVSGVYGKAAGIGTSSAFGGGSGRNHAYSEALQTQSMKTKWVVAAHELGHVLGGSHPDGVTSGCAGGLLSGLCGPSLMPAGRAGAPDTRMPYFSSANDDNILAVLQGVL